MLARVERIEHHFCVQVALSKDADAVERFVLQHFLVGQEGFCELVLCHRRLDALGQKVAYRDFLNVGVHFEELYEVVREVTETDYSNAEFHVVIPFKFVLFGSVHKMRI